MQQPATLNYRPTSSCMSHFVSGHPCYVCPFVARTPLLPPPDASEPAPTPPTTDQPVAVTSAPVTPDPTPAPVAPDTPAPEPTATPDIPEATATPATPESPTAPDTPEPTGAPDTPEATGAPSGGDGVGYVHLGCFKDSKMDRVLLNALTSDDMTTQVMVWPKLLLCAMLMCAIFPAVDMFSWRSSAC